MNLSPSHLHARKQVDKAVSLLIRTVRFVPYLLITAIILTLLNTAIRTTLIKNGLVLQHLTLFQFFLKIQNIPPGVRIAFHFGGSPFLSFYTEAILNTFRVAAGGTLTAFIPALVCALWLSRFQSRPNPLPVIVRLLKRIVSILPQVPPLLYGVSAAALISTVHANSGNWPLNYFQTSALMLGVIMIPELIQMMEREFSQISPELRLASYALGATQHTVIFKQVLPMGFRMILAGTLKAAGRVIGLAAPFIVLGFEMNTPAAGIPERIFLLAGEKNPLSQSSAAAAALILIGLIVMVERTTLAMTRRILRQKEGLR